MASWSSFFPDARRAARAAAALSVTLFLIAASPSAPIDVKADAEPSKVRPGRAGTIEVEIDIADGYHLQAHKPTEEFYVATTLTWVAPRGIRMGASRFPEAKLETVSFDEKPVALYADEIKVTTPFRVLRTARPGVYKLRGTLHYQACNDAACLAPAKAPVTVTVRVKA